MSERKAGDPVCKCNLQCDANVSPDQRKALFDGFGKLQTLTFRMPTYVDVCRYQKSNNIIQEKEVSPAGFTVDSTTSKLALFQ